MLLFALMLGSAAACEPAEDAILEIWPGWGPHPGHGLIRVRTGDVRPELTLIDASGGARSLGARPLEAPSGSWWSFELPEALPFGDTTLNVSPGPVSVELELRDGLSQAPPLGELALNEVRFSQGGGCPEDPEAIVAQLDLVLPEGPSGGWIAELREAELGPFAWLELPPERGPASAELVFARGELSELCLDVDLYNVSHLAETHLEIPCVAVPEDYLSAEEPPSRGCAVLHGGGWWWVLAVLGLLRVSKRVQETRCPT